MNRCHLFAKHRCRSWRPWQRYVAACPRSKSCPKRQQFTALVAAELVGGLNKTTWPGRNDLFWTFFFWSLGDWWPAIHSWFYDLVRCLHPTTLGWTTNPVRREGASYSGRHALFNTKKTKLHRGLSFLNSSHSISFFPNIVSAWCFKPISKTCCKDW